MTDEQALGGTVRDTTATVELPTARQRPPPLSFELHPCPPRASGWVGIRVRQDPAPEALVAVLGELRGQSCGHSWRSHLPESGTIERDHAVELIARENERRPTWFFTYSGVDRGGREELFGVATVSPRIQARFPHAGFPVLARSYVRLPFRGRGLYGVLLRHRLALCVARFGDTLRAIHFGTVDPRVLDAARNPANTPFPFVHVGDELLTLPSGARRVPDYLAFAPSFVDRLRAEVAAHGCPAIAAHLEQLVTRGFGASGHRALSASLGPALRTAPAWRSLLAFLDAVPVIS